MTDNGSDLLYLAVITAEEQGEMKYRNKKESLNEDEIQDFIETINLRLEKYGFEPVKTLEEALDYTVIAHLKVKGESKMAQHWFNIGKKQGMSTK